MSADPAVEEAVEALRLVLAETGHPVIDTLVLSVPSTHETLLRVEFGYDGRRVGVLRSRVEDDLTLVTTTARDHPFAPPRVETESSSSAARLHEVLAALPPGTTGAGEVERDLASNDDLRALHAVPGRERRAAADAVLLAAAPGPHLLVVRHLLELERHRVAPVATREVAAAVRLLLADLATGVPAEWAVRRLLAAEGVS